MSKNDTMQAIRFHEYGGPEKLVLERVSRPIPEAGSVLVRVHAAGVNPWDWKSRSGAYKQFMPLQFPYTPGIELSGVIAEVGSGVTGLRVGQAVFGNAPGGAYAEYAVVPATSLAPKPASLTFDQAAAVPVGAQTAWRSLFDAGNLQAGQHILIQGGAGGVGSMAVQLAHWKGAHVTATASANNHAFVRSLGAETVIDYQSSPFESAVHDMDMVLDAVGGDLQERSLHVLRPGGILVTIAGQPPLEKAQALGVRAASPGRADPATNAAMLGKISELIEAGKIKVEVTTVFPLAEASKAHALSQGGHGRGRIVLHIADRTVR